MTTNKLFVLLLTAVLLLAFGCGEKKVEVVKEKVLKVLESDTLTQAYLASIPAEEGGVGFTGEGWFNNDGYESTADPKGISGGQLTMSTTSFPSTLRILGKDNNSWLNSWIGGMVYEGMIGTHSNTLEIVPSLATNWKWEINEGDTLKPQTFWFRINPKAKWADGSPLTAYDVVATWDLLMDETILFPSTQLTYGQYYRPEAVSPYIVKVSTRELNWRLFLYIGGMAILPQKEIGNLTGTEYLKEYQFKMLMGSGSYELKEDNIVKQRSITVTKRDGYWDEDNPKGKGSGNFDRIKWIIVADERLAFEKFKKGETDIYVVGRAQWWKEQTNFDNVERGLIQKRKIYNDSPQGTAGLVFNMRKPPFDDLRIRQAFSHLINREKLITSLFFNEYEYIDSYYPGGIYENPNNPKYRYDADKAVKLLAEAGWKERNQEGWLQNANNEVFEIDLMYSQQGWERIFTVLQEDLASVGVKMNLKQSTDPTMFKMVMERKFSVHWQGWTGLTFPNPETSFASELADIDNNNNLAGVKNSRIDELMKEYNITFDQGRRIEIIREIDGILMEIRPYALGWYGPFSRILYWNKFGHPDNYYSRTSSWYAAIPSLWWIDPVKEKKLEEAKNDESIRLPVGEVEVKYWADQEKKKGRNYTSDF